MTGAQTDPVSVGAAEQAAAILYKLASPAFQHWLKEHGNTDAYEHWSTLRRVAGQILTKRSATITTDQCAALIGPFKFVHDLAHDYDPEDPVTGECHCPTAEAMRDFAEITFGCEAGLL